MQCMFYMNKLLIAYVFWNENTFLNGWMLGLSCHQVSLFLFECSQDFAKGPVRCVCRSHVVWLARILTRIQDSWRVIHGCHHSIQSCCWLDDCGKSIRGFQYLASSGRVIHLIFRRVYGLPSSSRFCWSVDSMRERRYVWLARVCKKKIESIIETSTLLLHDQYFFMMIQ